MKKGFTLIELLIVVAIIGILAASIVYYLGKSKSQALDKKMQSTIHNLQVKIELYNLKHGRYPNGIFNTAVHPVSVPSQSITTLADLLEVDPSDLYPCGGEWKSGCERYIQYVSDQDGYYWQPSSPTTRKCWKNHYVIFYTLENSSTPFQPEQEMPCTGFLIGDQNMDDIFGQVNYCQSNPDDWWCRFQGRDYALVLN